jgi:hypothetical protein
MNALELGQMVLSVELITPAIAARWLTLNATNRRLRKRIVDQYTRDMLRGRWEMKPIAVCFDEQGRLGNGQHTLSAIVNSKQEQRLLIARNCSAASIASMDLGLRRSIADTAHFLGLDFGRRVGTIGRIVVYGIEDDFPRSFEELHEAYRAHEEVIDQCTSFARGNKVGLSAPVFAVGSRALYSYSHELIERFFDILSSGIVEGEHESAAVRLRDFSRSLKGATSKALRVETYRKAEAFLLAFLEQRPLKKVYGMEEEQFPLPSE